MSARAAVWLTAYAFACLTRMSALGVGVEAVGEAQQVSANRRGGPRADPGLRAAARPWNGLRRNRFGLPAPPMTRRR